MTMNKKKIRTDKHIDRHPPDSHDYSFRPRSTKLGFRFLGVADESNQQLLAASSDLPYSTQEPSLAQICT